MISERIFSIKSEDSFICGILHDIGLIIEYQLENKLFHDIVKSYNPNNNNLCDLERKIIGTDHCMVGEAISKEWKLPLDVQLGIKTHHA